jgi:GDP-4-dehydro-6-deoxy-D-mannose reductase
MKILVTGANGFVGQHLVKHLISEGHSIVATGQAPLATTDPMVTFYAVDLMDAKAVSQLPLTEIEGIIHLAGLAAVGPSFDNPELYKRVNPGMQNNLYSACIAAGVTPKVLIISSGSLFDPTAQLPINEQAPVKPSSPYAESKLEQEAAAIAYQNQGFKTVIARPFNHIGPGQREGFIVADLAKQIAEAERTGATDIMVGNLDAKRDYTDVRDIVRAYALLLELGTGGQIYNICTGRSLSGHQILEGLLANSSSDLVPVEDPAKMRPSDVADIYGDNSKISTATGWKPGIKLEQTLADTLEYWRAQ